MRYKFPYFVISALLFSTFMTGCVDSHVSGSPSMSTPPLPPPAPQKTEAERGAEHFRNKDYKYAIAHFLNASWEVKNQMSTDPDPELARNYATYQIYIGDAFVALNENKNAVRYYEEAVNTVPMAHTYKKLIPLYNPTDDKASIEKYSYLLVK